MEDSLEFFKGFSARLEKVAWYTPGLQQLMSYKNIFSPYRICPIGAHIDHQGGPVLGRTINLGTTLTYEAMAEGVVQLTSPDFGQVEFSIGDLDRSHWARYAQAAARVLNPKRGMRASVHGALIGSGLSSSASVGLAYLRALAEVNGINFTAGDLVAWDYQLEHDELGLQNGLLDPMSIVHGRKDALLFMDTVSGSVIPVLDHEPVSAVWIIAYSGVSRELTKSGFNVRVTECHHAASLLKPGAQKLGDVPREVFETEKAKLLPDLRRRAEHFFGEVERVHLGRQAWAESDAARFGELMNRSCASSINHYQSGSEVLIHLHEIVSSTTGVYGSRFSGGGYGGCVVALVEKNSAPAACDLISEKFSALYPNLPSKVFVVETTDGFFPAGVRSK